MLRRIDLLYKALNHFKFIGEDFVIYVCPEYLEIVKATLEGMEHIVVDKIENFL
jgi:hypothetical protein